MYFGSFPHLEWSSLRHGLTYNPGLLLWCLWACMYSGLSLGWTIGEWWELQPIALCLTFHMCLSFTEYMSYLGSGSTVVWQWCDIGVTLVVWQYSGVTLVWQWCDSTVVWQWCDIGVTVQWCDIGVTLVWQYSGVTLVWQYSGVTLVWHWCDSSVTVVWQWCDNTVVQCSLSET
jgi:hypothetical protein